MVKLWRGSHIPKRYLPVSYTHLDVYKRQQNEHALCDVYLLDMETKLRRIQKLGLSYLTLNRSMISLSNGEAQRLHLASLLDATMSGLLYILDEPTIGLHPKDTDAVSYTHLYG